MANPYIAYALLIYAGLDGIENRLALTEPTNLNLYTASSEVTDKLDRLPETLTEAIDEACRSSFVAEVLPDGFAQLLKI